MGGSSTRRLRSKSGVADHSDVDVEPGVCRMHLCCASSPKAPRGTHSSPAWSGNPPGRAVSDAARHLQQPILEPHFSQRRNPRASEVGKSPLSCSNGNVLITLQLAFTEHSQRNRSWQGECNPTMMSYCCATPAPGAMERTALSRLRATSLQLPPHEERAVTPVEQQRARLRG